MILRVRSTAVLRPQAAYYDDAPGFDVATHELDANWKGIEVELTARAWPAQPQPTLNLRVASKVPGSVWIDDVEVTVV